MALGDILRSLREFDVHDIDPENVGSWPTTVRAAVWAAALAVVLAAGYLYRIQDLRVSLERAVAEEEKLRSEFERKAFQAANLDAYRKRMAEMEESFGALVSQLPGDTEVPGLLEDITDKGLRNGLEFDSIELRPEIVREFYVELPIQIIARGSYHDLGAFVSGMAGLPRIVTLHDFHIAREGSENGALRLEIEARTYRYRDEET